MVLTLFLFLHLVATCAAIGTIIVTDLRLVSRLIGYRAVIPQPERLERALVMASLVVLCATGLVLVLIGLQDRPDYLANGKLQGKLVLVGILTLNAFMLHFRAFPILARARPVSEWTRPEWCMLAASVALSHSLWFFCAFLGVARVWNFQVSPAFVLGVASAAWAGMFLLTNLLLHLGARDAPRQEPDRIDAAIMAFHALVRVAPARPDAGRIDLQHPHPSANQQHYGRRIADRRAGGLTDRRGRGT